VPATLGMRAALGVLATLGVLAALGVRVALGPRTDTPRAVPRCRHRPLPARPVRSSTPIPYLSPVPVCLGTSHYREVQGSARIDDGGATQRSRKLSAGMSCSLIVLGSQCS